MHTSFTSIDWMVLGGYVLLLAVAGWLTTRRGMKSEDYFLASHHAPTWLVAVSVLSTVQSAATFLGVPDNSFRGDYTYLGGVLAALIAAWVVSNVLIPRFYALRVTTVYELLEARFDPTARRAAGLPSNATITRSGTAKAPVTANTGALTVCTTCSTTQRLAGCASRPSTTSEAPALRSRQACSLWSCHTP